MIQCTVTLDREDIIGILADVFGVDADKVQMNYVETDIEDDIRAVIGMPNPLKKAKNQINMLGHIYKNEGTRLLLQEARDRILKREFQKEEGSRNDWDPMRDLRITCREVPKEMG